MFCAFLVIIASSFIGTPFVTAPLTRLNKGTWCRKISDGTWQPHDASGSSSLLPKWGPAHDPTFNFLKEALSNPLTLGFPDFTAPFIVYVDASHDGMAVCLYQPFIPSSQLPLMSKSVSPATPFAFTHLSFSFDFDDGKLNKLRTNLQSDCIFSHTYQLMVARDSPPSDRFEIANVILYCQLRDGCLAVTGPLIWHCPVTTIRTADTSIPISRVLPHNY